MWYEHPLFNIIFGVLIIVCVIAILSKALKCLFWFLKRAFFFFRVVTSPLLCGLLERHDYKEVYRKENSDHFHVESKCMFCRSRIVEQKN